MEESQPPLYYFRDKHGDLQPVPNFTLEDFEDLYKLKHQLAEGSRRPGHSLQHMSIAGSVAAGDLAELTVEFEILLGDDLWTRVPLRLDDAVLREPAQWEGKGEQFLHFEGEGEGYVAWIRGQPGQTQRVTLKMLVPLTRMADQTRLHLLCRGRWSRS